MLPSHGKLNDMNSLKKNLNSHLHPAVPCLRDHHLHDELLTKKVSLVTSYHCKNATDTSMIR